MADVLRVRPLPSFHSASTKHPDGVDGLIAEHCAAVQMAPRWVADIPARKVAAAYRDRMADGR